MEEDKDKQKRNAEEKGGFEGAEEEGGGKADNEEEK
jgi:hypothetical protein